MPSTCPTFDAVTFSTPNPSQAVAMSATTTDQALLTAYVDRRDEQAFTDLVLRYATVVHASCRRRLGDGLADDAAQAVFLLLERKAATLARDPRPLGPWLFAAAALVARNQQRSEKRYRSHTKELRMLAAPGQTHESWPEVRAHLDAALDDLPEQYRAPLILHYLHGQERHQLSEALAISAEALKKRISRGLDLLRQALARRGVAVPLATLLAALPSAQAEATASAAPASALASGMATPSTTALALTQGTALPLTAITLSLVATTVLGGGSWMLFHSPAVEPPVPPPAPPVVTPALVAPQANWSPNTSLWYLSMVEWTFTADAGTVPPPEELLPSAAAQATVFNVLVPGGLQKIGEPIPVQVRPVLYIHAREGLPAEATVTVTTPDGELRFPVRDGSAMLSPSEEQMTLGIGEDRVIPISYRLHPSQSLSLILLGLGQNDFIHPRPAGLQPGQPHALADQNSVTWHLATEAGPDRLVYTQTIARELPRIFDSSFTIGGIPLPVTLDALVDGSTRSEVRNDAKGFAADSSTSARFRIGIRATGSKDLAYAGTIELRTTAIRLAVDNAPVSLAALPALVPALSSPEVQALATAWAAGESASTSTTTRANVISIGACLRLMPTDPPTFLPNAEPAPNEF